MNWPFYSWNVSWEFNAKGPPFTAPGGAPTGTQTPTECSTADSVMQ